MIEDREEKNDDVDMEEPKKQNDDVNMEEQKMIENKKQKEIEKKDKDDILEIVSQVEKQIDKEKNEEDEKQKQFTEFNSKALELMEGYKKHDKVYKALIDIKKEDRVPSLKQDIRSRLRQYIKDYKYNLLTEKEIENMVTAFVNILLPYYGFDPFGNDLGLKQNLDNFEMTPEEKKTYENVWAIKLDNDNGRIPLLNRMIKIYLPLYNDKNTIPYDLDLLLEKKRDIMLKAHNNDLSFVENKNANRKETFNKANQLLLDDIEKFKKINTIDERRKALENAIKEKMNIVLSGTNITEKEIDDISNFLLTYYVADGMFSDLVK